MRTYQVFQNNSLIADKVSIEEARKHLPAGCKLTSGNTSRTSYDTEGKLITHTEIKATYKSPTGGNFSIIELPL